MSKRSLEKHEEDCILFFTQSPAMLFV